MIQVLGDDSVTNMHAMHAYLCAYALSMHASVLMLVCIIPGIMHAKWELSCLIIK